MLVPGHLVSLYVATSGASGSNLGSDEKEVILLVYAIIEVQTARVSYSVFIVNLLNLTVSCLLVISVKSSKSCQGESGCR